MTTQQIPQLKQLETWQANIDGYRIKIIRQDEEYRNRVDVPGWCYYIVIPERNVPSKFRQLWLEPKKYTWGVSYDYSDTPISGLNWHGGVTFYQKHGEVEGHRAVEFGCDYSHYWDQGQDYRLEDVYADALVTLDEIKAWVAEE